MLSEDPGGDEELRRQRKPGQALQWVYGLTLSSSSMGEQDTAHSLHFNTKDLYFTMFKLTPPTLALVLSTPLPPPGNLHVVPQGGPSHPSLR